MRVAICVPSGDEVKADFCVGLAYLVAHTAQHGSGIQIPLINARMTVIERSRYRLVQEALRQEADKLLFIDSDMSFPPDALLRLVAHDRAIVGATYVRRREPHDLLGVGIEDSAPGATGLWEMARMPAGFLMIDTKVFGTIPRPWFANVFDPEADDFVSEDHTFCDLARAAGHRIWCDQDLSHELSHVGTQGWSWAWPATGPLRPAAEGEAGPAAPLEWSYNATLQAQQAERLARSVEVASR